MRTAPCASNQQTSALRVDAWLEIGHLGFALGQVTRHTLRVEGLGKVSERHRTLVGGRHLQGAMAHVGHVHARVVANALDERVVARKALGADLLQCAVVRALDVRAQHARGRL